MPSSREALREAVRGVVSREVFRSWDELPSAYRERVDSIVAELMDLFGTPASGATPATPPDAKEPVR